MIWIECVGNEMDSAKIELEGEGIEWAYMCSELEHIGTELESMWSQGGPCSAMSWTVTKLALVGIETNGIAWLEYVGIDLEYAGIELASARIELEHAGTGLECVRLELEYVRIELDYARCTFRSNHEFGYSFTSTCRKAAHTNETDNAAAEIAHRCRSPFASTSNATWYRVAEF